MAEVGLCFTYPQNELERRAVTRFWALYCKQIGSTLSSFEASPEVVLERLVAGIGDPVMPDVTLDRSQTRFVMIRYTREEGATPDSTSDNSSQAKEEEKRVSIPLKEDVVAPEVGETLAKAVKALPVAKLGFVNIAAVWTSSSPADVDLWLRPSPEAEEISFTNKVTKEGILLRDITSPEEGFDSPDWKALWEVVSVKSEVLDKATLWVNLFSGGVGSDVSGIIRITGGDVVRDVPFSFEAGTASTKRHIREGNPSWIPIKLGLDDH